MSSEEVKNTPETKPETAEVPPAPATTEEKPKEPIPPTTTEEKPKEAAPTPATTSDSHDWADLADDGDDDEEDETPEEKPEQEGLQDEDDAVITITDEKKGNEALEKLLAAEKFEDLNLPKDILDAIYNIMKFNRPSKIQAQALPYILSRPARNLVAQAVNGSGKTVCFLLGILMSIDRNVPYPQAVCIFPTRELAVQTFDILSKLVTFSHHSSNLVVERPNAPVTGQIIIGTSGSISKACQFKNLNLNTLKILVFDEADELTMTQYNSVTTITKGILKAAHPQVLLFSATYPAHIKKMVQYLAPDALTITKTEKELNLTNIVQFYVNVDKTQKMTIINDLYSVMTVGQTIIFCEKKVTCMKLTKYLRNSGHKVGILTGGLLKEQRDTIMQEFRGGVTKILITTNVMSRGIDVSGVTLVINYDLPVNVETKKVDCETYLHRIGRTGRMGKKGCAVNLIANGLDMDHLNFIKQKYASTITQLPSDNLELMEETIKKAMKQ